MLIKFANADLLEAKVAHRGDTLLRTAHRATFNYEPREGFLYVRSRAISSRTNDNFDTWPADELRQAWATFIGKPVFVNHHNKDHRRARGVIIDAVLHEDTSPDGTPDTWVEVLMEVDAVRFPKLARAILAGDIERTSMGADVGETECSYCGNVATTPDTYCVHVSRHKGQRLLRKNADGTQEDVLVHEICKRISFFENSLLVEPPADPTAFFLGVDDTGVRSMGMQMRTASREATSKISDDEYVKLTPEQKQRFDGTTVRRDSKGFYCHTHRARSESYPSIDEIPDEDVRFIESTGSLSHGSADYDSPERWEFATKSWERDRSLLVRSETHDGIDFHLVGPVDDEGDMQIYALDGGKVVGDVFFGRPTQTSDWIEAAVQVHPDYRRRGIASAMYQMAERETGLKMKPSPGHSDLAEKLWQQPNRTFGYLASTAAERTSVAAPLDPDLCPASNQAIDNPQRRMRMACPACGKMLGGGRSPITKIPRHKPFVRGASEMATVEKTAWGEMKAPAVVNTLGLVECPVCGERNKFDGTGRCTVCGFLPPPEPFREPDLEVAQKVDMRDGWVNPELLSAPAFVPPEEGDDEADPVQKDIAPNEGAERTGGIRMRPSEAIAQRQAQQIQALRAENARLRAAQGGRQRRADVNNPGQPVPEPAAQSGVSTEETRSPDATADVTSGSAVLTDVGPATTTDVTSPGAAMTNVAPLANADVTAPVAGTTEMPPYADTVIKIEPDASGGTDTAPAFSGDSSWVQARKAAEAHVFASLRLARLRIRAGIESGDDLVIAEKIAATTRPEIVRTQIATLDQVVRSASVQQQRRPAPHVAQRTAPSLASMAVPGIQAVGGFAGLAVSQDEVGLFD